MEMEMADRLMLRLLDYNIRQLQCMRRGKQHVIVADEDKIIQHWYFAHQSPFCEKNFSILLRHTLLLVLSSNPLKELKKKELLKGTSLYFSKFSGALKLNSDIRKPLIDFILNPWNNKHFSWDELFKKRISVCDERVQQYFYTEPEEMVIARVHYFSSVGKNDTAMIIAKNSFLFHYRIKRTFKYLDKCSKTTLTLHCDMNRKGIPSVDWYLFHLRRKKSYSAMHYELKQLVCDEGVLLIMRLRGLKVLPLALFVVQIFIMQDLIYPSKFCCTKKLFTLWALLHKENKTPLEEICEEIRKIVAVYAPSSSHFYLLVDVFWEQFGMSSVNMYVELYIRGLTSDLNLLEAAKNQDKHEDVNCLESQMSSMFYKLSTLFIDYHQRAARECMFSAFSLKPTKKILYILQSMTHSILSDENEMIFDSLFNHNVSSVQECKCAIKCTGFCKSVKEHVLDHPILMKGIPNIPYSDVKDLVSILESVRCFRFQYNVFDWRKNAIDLGDYLRDFTLCKSYESDTECEEDNVSGTEQTSPTEKVSSDSNQPAMKRKSDSCDLKETVACEMVGANIEVRNEEFVNKKIRLEDQSKNISNTNDILNMQSKLSQKYGVNLGMEVAIENVIRATLDNNKQKSCPSLDKFDTTYSNSSFNNINDQSENLSSLYKSASENLVYPYSLTNYGKEKKLKTGTSFNSEVESSLKYNYVPPSSSVLSRVLTSPINRGSVISPTLHLQKSCSAIHEQSSRQFNQNNNLLKPVNDTYYNKLKNIQTNASTSVTSSVYHQKTHNYNSETSIYGHIRNISNTVSQNSQFISNQTNIQVSSNSNAASDFTKEHFLISAISSANTVTSPLNLSQPKLKAVQSPQYLPVAHHRISKTSSTFRADSRYQTLDTVSKSIAKRLNENVCFQSDQLAQCDRSSVIQHTMQHVKESNSQISLNEVGVPNQLAVSVNSDAAEQIRSVPKKNQLPPFTVNVSDRSISNSSLAVSAKLVIPRKSQSQNEAPSQPISSNVSPVTSDIITIPGILAPPSVIVSPWEAQRKVHGEMMYKKNSQITGALTIDKRIYKNRSIYGKPAAIKSESKILGHDKNNNSQMFKVGISTHNPPNIHVISCTNQSNVNASQNWTAFNKSSSQVSSQTTSSQPWYSEPYPKPQGNRNISSTLTGNATSSEKSLVKIFPNQKNDSKSFATFSTNTMKLSENQTTVTPATASSSSHSINSVSDHPIKPHAQYISTFAALNSSNSAIANTVDLSKDNNVPSSSNYVNIKNYSSTIRSGSAISSNQISDKSQLVLETTLNKSSSAYSPSTLMDNSLQFSQVSPRTHQNSCCSPSELNPCQNCSLPSEVQASSEKSLTEHMIHRREKMVVKTNIVSAAFNSNIHNVKEMKNEQSQIIHLNCPYCTNPFSENELQIHILNCELKDLSVKNSNLINEINSNVMATENYCTKSLPEVVPEQNSFFEKQAFFDLSPSPKPFLNLEDIKNTNEFDENAAMTVCMNIINNTEDFEKFVEEIPLDQIDNNYLSYIPSTEHVDNFSHNNLCNDVHNEEKLLQGSAAFGKFDEVDNYDIYNGSLLDEKKQSIYDFHESKSVLQPASPKSKISCIENVPTNALKDDDEYNFGKLFKNAVNSIGVEPSSEHQYESNCSNRLESVEMCSEVHCDLNSKVIQNPQDLASSVVKNDHTHTGNNSILNNISLEKTKTLKRKFSYHCLYCPKKYSNTVNVKRHVSKLHPDLPVGHYREHISSSNVASDKSTNNLKSKDRNSSQRNSYRTTNNLNYVLDYNNKQNILLPKNNALPKGKIKGIIKNPQTECKICRKILTVIYLRKHMLTQHNVKYENSSEMNAEMNENLIVDSVSPVDSVNIRSVSPLIEQDFDSSTCLSASDALKKNSSFSVTETSDNFDNSEKLVEKTNVKFNFNVLEFSREAEYVSKITSAENSNLNHEYTSLENFNPENHRFLENMQNFKEKNTYDTPYLKPNKGSRDRQICYICHKSYHNKGNLTRHLNDVHNKKISMKKNKVKNDNLKIKKSDLKLHTNFQKDTNASIEPLYVAEKETPIPSSADLAKIKKIPNNSANFITQPKDQDNASHPISKKNLLKAVLKSNFTKKHKLSQKSSKKGNSLQNKQINTSIASNMSLENSKNISSMHEYLLENQPSSNLELKSRDKTLALMPFENVPQDLKRDQEECPNLFISRSEVNNELSSSIHISYAKHLPMGESQNLSVQSCEISPVSKIISNISKCDFGGTSNKDDKKESFEDNSLKLVIPEDKDANTNRAIKSLEEIDKSKTVHVIESKMNDQNIRPDNISTEHVLNSVKNDLQSCDQKSKQEEIFHKKLSDSTSSSLDFDISEKKSKLLNSVDCEMKEIYEGKVRKMNSFVLEDSSLKNKTPSFENTDPKYKCCEIENISQKNESFKQENMFNNEACDFENIGNNLSVLVEKSCKNKNAIPVNSSCDYNFFSSENKKIIPRNDSGKDENSMSMNNSYENKNIIAENGSCQDEIGITEKKFCENENMSEIKHSKNISENWSWNDENIITEIGPVEDKSALLQTKPIKGKIVLLKTNSVENDNSFLQTGPIVKDNDLPHTESVERNNAILVTAIDDDKNTIPETGFAENDYVLLEIGSVVNDNVLSETRPIKDNNVLPEALVVNDVVLSEIGPVEDENILPKTGLEDDSVLSETGLVEDDSVFSETGIIEDDSILPETGLVENDSILSEFVFVEDDDVSEIGLVEDDNVVTETGPIEDDSVILETRPGEKKFQEKENCLPSSGFYNDENIVQDTMSIENVPQSTSIENMLENELCENVNVIPKNRSCELENTTYENAVQKSENVLSKSEFCEVENSLLPVCNTVKILQKNECSEMNNSLKCTSQFKYNLYKKEMCNFEGKLQQSELCAYENILQEKHSVQEFPETKNIPQKKELSEVITTLSNPSNEFRCAFCQKKFDSQEMLSKHLQELRDLPRLKKQVSKHSQEKSKLCQNIKLSPPKLKLGSNESDSESLSDFDSPQNSSKATNGSTSPQRTSRNETLTEDILPKFSFPVKQNVQTNRTKLSNLSPAFTESFNPTKNINKVSKEGNLLNKLPSTSPIARLNHWEMPTYKSRKHSFDDIYSIFPVEHLGNEHLSYSNNKFDNGKRKSISLPDIKIVFPFVKSSQTEDEINCTKPFIVKNIYVESSLSEDVSFGSMNDSIENCKSSFDSSLSSCSSISHSNTVPLNEITINSNFILPSRISSASKIRPKNMILKSKLSGRKLIIRRLKTFKKKIKRKSKSKLFSRKKMRTNKTLTPIVLTLKEATEVEKFLETHKQPVVKLVRLKENEFVCSSNRKTDPISCITYDKINMEAVVKLEKIQIPKKVDETIVINEDFISNSLQQNNHPSVSSRKILKTSRKNCPNLRKKPIRSRISQTLELSVESIDISSDSSDSIQFLEQIDKEEKSSLTPDFCSTPETKKCFVVLNRLSI